MNIRGLILLISPLVALSVNSVNAEPSTVAVPQKIEVPSSISQLPNPESWELLTIGDSRTAAATSVSELSDVKTTDWAFTALQSLVERYGCIVGYPNGTFRGDRSISRYEFAAGLNACLDKINELVASGLSDKVGKEDLAVLQKLQEEFAREITALKGRIDSLEARTTILESQQFSTTTKLVGQVVASVSAGGFSGDRIIDTRGRTITTSQPNTTVIYRAFFDLNTSFTGKDLLKVKIWTGSNGANDSSAGFLEPNFGSALDYSARSGVNNTFSLARLVYSFNASPDIRVSLGPVINAVDYLDKNRYSNLAHVDFSTQSLVNNFILFPINGFGAGAAVDWRPNKGPFSLRAVYSAADSANPTSANQPVLGVVSSFAKLILPNGGNRGFFGDPYQGIIELEYAPSSNLALRLQYSGGNVFSSRYSVFGANLEWAITDKIGIFGRYGNGTYSNTSFGDINPQYWSAGLSFSDLFMQGSITGVAVVQPFIASQVGNATQTNYELFYNMPLIKGLRLTPTIQVITNAANQSANGTIVTGTLRTVFSF